MAEKKDLPAKKDKQELSTNVGEDTGKGQTTIADQVVSKVAGLAVREIEGVYALGNSAARALGAIRDAVGMDENIKQGVSVEVGQTQAAVDLIVIAEYPYPIHKVADDVRDAVFKAIEDIVGLEVTEVNIKIADVHIETDDDEDSDNN